VRLAAYLRISTKEQAEHGYGLPQQRAQITAWAKRHGHRIALWERDEGQSGSNGLDARVGLYGALQAVESGEVEGLVVKQLDRLARDLVLQETLLARIWRHGAQVFSTIEAESDSLADGGEDPTRNLTRQILGAIAEYERALIVMRLRGGKLAKQAEGGYVGGRVPYGSQLTDDGKLEPDEAEREVVRRMQTMRESGASYREICAALNGDGIHTKSGTEWVPPTVRTILLRVGQMDNTS